MTLQQKEAQLLAKIDALQPLSDSQLQAFIESGQSADSLIENETRNATALRVATIELKSVREKMQAERISELVQQITTCTDQREKVKAQAVESLKRLKATVDALEAELAVFDGHSDEAARLANLINRYSRESGKRELIRNDALTSPLFFGLLQRCHAALEPRRNSNFKETIYVEC